MKTNNPIQDKSFEFAKLIVLEMCRFTVERKEYILSKQLMRSGTAIGAIASEALHAQSKADFISKLSMALKEANEANYWLRLMKETAIYINDELINLSLEIIKILSSIIITMKKQLKSA